MQKQPDADPAIGSQLQRGRHHKVKRRNGQGRVGAASRAADSHNYASGSARRTYVSQPRRRSVKNAAKRSSVIADRASAKSRW